MADTSIAVDIPLMHAIAQSSATFVAILAGFYTSKILSISGEIRRVTAKIKEFDNEIEWETHEIQKLSDQIDQIERDWTEESVNSFRSYVVPIPSRIESILTLDDLKRSFKDFIRNYGQREPSEIELKVLEKESESILKEIRNNRDFVDSPRPDLDFNTISIPVEKSHAQEFHEALQSTDERRNKKKMDDTIATKRSRISFLHSQRRDLIHEWDLWPFLNT